VRVVIDTNIWVMAISSRSKYHYIYEQLIAGNFDLILSNAIALEYKEILETKYSLKAAGSFFSLLGWLSNIHHTEPPFSLKLIPLDPDDDKFADAAVWGLVDFIVTEDQHFQALNKVSFPSISVKSIDEFMEILKKRHE